MVCPSPSETAHVDSVGRGRRAGTGGRGGRAMGLYLSIGNGDFRGLEVSRCLDVQKLFQKADMTSMALLLLVVPCLRVEYVVSRMDREPKHSA